MYVYILINSIFPFCRFFPKFHFSSSFLRSQHFDFLDLTAPIALEIENMCKNGNVRLVPNIQLSKKISDKKIVIGNFNKAMLFFLVINSPWLLIFGNFGRVKLLNNFILVICFGINFVYCLNQYLDICCIFC